MKVNSSFYSVSLLITFIFATIVA